MIWASVMSWLSIRRVLIDLVSLELRVSRFARVTAKGMEKRELHSWSRLFAKARKLGTPAAWRSLCCLWYPISVSDSSSGCTRSSIRRLHSNWMRIECIGLTFTCSHFAILFHIQIPCINGMSVMGFIKVVKSWKIWLSDLLWEFECSSSTAAPAFNPPLPLLSLLPFLLLLSLILF